MPNVLKLVESSANFFVKKTHSKPKIIWWWKKGTYSLASAFLKPIVANSRYFPKLLIFKKLIGKSWSIA